MAKMLLVVTICLLSLLPSSGNAGDDEPLVQHIRDGETKKVYWAINITGVVYLSIRSRTGTGCARMFWRPIPTFGRTFSLNDVCGNVRAEVPGSSKWAVGGELWARANQGDIAIVLGSKSEQVVYDFPAVEFP